MTNGCSVISPSTCFPTIGNYWGDTGINSQNSSMVAASRTAKGHSQCTNLAWFTNDTNGGSGYEWLSSGSAAALMMLGYAQNLRS